MQTTPATIERPQQLAQLLNGVQASVREYRLDCGRDVYDYKGAIHRVKAHRVKGGIRFRLNGAPSGRDAIFAAILGGAE